MFIDICDKVLQTNAAYEKNTKIREYKVISRITEELMIEADDLLILFGKMELLNKIANI